MASSVALVETQEGDVAKAADKASCVKCGCPTDDFDSHSLQCRQCWNVHQILYRHLGGAPSTLQSLQPDEQKKFFKDVGSKMKITPKNGRWALVRAAMVKSITHYRKEERVTSVKRKFLPLSVLEKKGYDVDAIKAHGDRREDEAPEVVYMPEFTHVSSQTFFLHTCFGGVTASVCYCEIYRYVVERKYGNTLVRCDRSGSTVDISISNHSWFRSLARCLRHPF